MLLMNTKVQQAGETWRFKWANLIPLQNIYNLFITITWMLIFRDTFLSQTITKFWNFNKSYDFLMKSGYTLLYFIYIMIY